jgi:hypothetical protein
MPRHGIDAKRRLLWVGQRSFDVEGFSLTFNISRANATYAQRSPSATGELIHDFLDGKAIIW